MTGPDTKYDVQIRANNSFGVAVSERKTLQTTCGKKNSNCSVTHCCVLVPGVLNVTDAEAMIADSQLGDGNYDVHRCEDWSM